MTERRHHDPFRLDGDEGLPYSKGVAARALIAAGVAAERAYELALRLEADLAARREHSIDFDRLEELAADVLGEDEGRQAVRRLRRFGELRELERPILLLIGGATGTGKSTVATEAAYRLGITRVASTDFVRHTMRAFFAKEFMPTIHYSSFEAGHAFGETEEGSDRVLLGFQEQTRNVLVGVEAAIDRALHEGWSMVLEGVHLVPGMLPRSIDGALVVQCVLAISSEEVHASHFLIRDTTTGGVRRLDKYLQGLGEIRAIQRYIVDRAEKAGVPVVENRQIEEAVGTVMDLVLAGAERLRTTETLHVGPPQGPAQ